MKIHRRSDQQVSEAHCKAATGRSLTEWFEAMDAAGGIGLGRRELGRWLMEMKVDPWWGATLNCEYEIARGEREKDGHARGYTICATKSVKADPARCYALFTQAVELDRWFGPGHQADLADGGVWQNADGNRAVVKKLSPGKWLKVVWEAPELTLPTPVEIKFPVSGAKTTITITIDRLQTRAEADGYRRAWGEALERLKALLEA